jgi:hypothetical protein
MPDQVVKDISGTWYNQLGSKMELTKDASGGLTGEYDSAVGSAKYKYTLTGRFDTSPPSGEGTSVGWVVTFHNSWGNAHSTATWSGQYFNVGSSGETILTHWLLTTSTTAANVWESTNIGHDTFTRNQPSAAEVEQAKLLTVGSPHVEQILAKRSQK